MWPFKRKAKKIVKEKKVEPTQAIRPNKVELRIIEDNPYILYIDWPATAKLSVQQIRENVIKLLAIINRVGGDNDEFYKCCIQAIANNAAARRENFFWQMFISKQKEAFEEEAMKMVVDEDDLPVVDAEEVIPND